MINRTAALLLTLFLISCGRQTISQHANQSTIKSKEPDYSLLDSWAAHPWKHDPSDSIPLPLQASYSKDSIADVFFLHPTSLTSYTNERWNAGIDDEALNNKTDQSSIVYQASAFAEKTRVFAPRYRQAHLRSYYTTDTLQALKAFDLAYHDIRSAFAYYLKHYNNKRPVIIASHSQGTTHAIRLLKEFFDDKPLSNQLIAAYLVGMQVPYDAFRSIPVCIDSSQNNCYVTWRTYKKGYIEPQFVANETTRTIVTNPLRWDTSFNYAGRQLNKGSVLRNFNKVNTGVTDAQRKGNVLWSSKPKFFGNVFLQTKNYHIADINFFYLNISDNIKVRIRKYLGRK